MGPNVKDFKREYLVVRGKNYSFSGSRHYMKEEDIRSQTKQKVILGG